VNPDERVTNGERPLERVERRALLRAVGPHRAEPLVQKSHSWTDRPQYLTHRGNIERFHGHYDIALPLEEEAVRLRDSREQRTTNETSGLAHSLMSLGRVQLNLKRLDEAERSVTRALDIVQRPGQDAEFRTWWASECRDWLGRIHVEQKRYADARKQFEAALERRRLLFGDSLLTGYLTRLIVGGNPARVLRRLDLSVSGDNRGQ